MKGETDRRNDFMINLQESYVAELGFELEIPGSAVCLVTECVADKKYVNAKKRGIQLFSAKLYTEYCYQGEEPNKLGPVVQSVVSLTSSLRVISLTVLADSIYNILIFLAEKM